MMRYIITGLLILLGIILFFMFITACSPSRTMTRDVYRSEKTVRETPSSRSDERDFSYEEDEGAADDRELAPRSRSPRRESSPVVRSGGADGSDAGDDLGNSSSEAESGESFDQKGEASWYGRAFHGKLTASGERFDMNKLSAAHKTLPFGTVLEVKNLNNDKSVRVRVNDRGPYRGGRIIDLSYAAARRLDMLGAGKAAVGIRVVSRGSGERETVRRDNADDLEPVGGVETDEGDIPERGERTGARDGFTLQAGAFYSRVNAERLQRKIEGMVRNPVTIIRDGDLFKVRIRDIRSQSEARRYRDMLNDENISSYITNDARE